MQLYLEFIKSKEKQINPKAMDIWQVLMTISVTQIKEKPDRPKPQTFYKNWNNIESLQNFSFLNNIWCEYLIVTHLKLLWCLYIFLRNKQT